MPRLSYLYNVDNVDNFVDNLIYDFVAKWNEKAMDCNPMIVSSNLTEVFHR